MESAHSRDNAYRRVKQRIAGVVRSHWHRLSQGKVAVSGLILSSPTCSNGTNGIARKRYLGNIKTLLFID